MHGTLIYQGLALEELNPPGITGRGWTCRWVGACGGSHVAGILILLHPVNDLAIALIRLGRRKEHLQPYYNSHCKNHLPLDLPSQW